MSLIPANSDVQPAMDFHENLLLGTLSNITEQARGGFVVEPVNDGEKKFINTNWNSMDVDYLSFTGKCTEILSKPTINQFFAHSTCKFLKTPFSKKVYSSTAKDILVIGNISEYTLGIVYHQSQTDVDFNDNYEIVVDSSIIQSGRQSHYAAICNSIRKCREDRMESVLDFVKIKESLLKYFPQSSIIIFRYGQKINYLSILKDLERIIEVDNVPFELALGRKYLKEGYFLSGKSTQKILDFSYSNFLSNDSVNILIKNPAVCQTYANNSFRICLYNTLQHGKNNISMYLKSIQSRKKFIEKSTALELFTKSSEIMDVDLSMLKDFVPTI